MLSFGSVKAQVGTINKNYGNNGIVSIDFGSNEKLYDVLATENQQFILTGTIPSLQKPTSFVIKTNENGSTVNTFGIAGRTVLSHPTWSIRATSLAVQSDGSYIVGGLCNYNDNSGLFLSRLDKNGNIDQSFGNNGYRLFSMDTNIIVTLNIAVIDNDNILVAGTGYGNKSLDVILLKFTKDGDLDLSYGAGGVYLYDVVNSTDYFQSLIKAENGSLYAISYLQTDVGEFSAITKFNGDGTIDRSWANNGRTFVNSAYLYTGTIDSKQRLTLLGVGRVNDYRVLEIIRLDSTGEQEESFGNQGQVHIKYPFEQPIPVKVLIQDDGKILSTGYLRTYHNYDIFIARVEEDGKIDSSFSYDGILTSNPTYGQEEVANAYFSEDGNLLVFGSIGNTNDGDIFITNFTLHYGLGIESISNENIVYPNPTQGVVNIKINSTIDHIKLISAEGQVLMLQTEKQLDLSEISRGTYIIEVLSDDKVYRSKLLLF